MEVEDLSALGLPRDVTTLAVSASSWVDDAMKAWAAGDFAKVGLLAPVAVEHLGKAVLWSKNPVLLVQLNASDEGALMALAIAPHLAAPGLRTIGLKLVLGRVEKILGGTPILVQPHRDRMVNVRNGITHVGTADLSRHVLLDSLTVINALLTYLGIDASTFYGSHAGHVTELLDAKRTETGHDVLEKRARAQQRVAELKDKLGEEAYEEAAAKLETQRTTLTWMYDPIRRLDAIDTKCPECENTGRTFGEVELDADADFDVEPLGGGQYETVPMPYWILWFAPQAFGCAVCQYTLTGTEELEEAGMSTQRREIRADDLGEDFDLDELVASEYGSESY